MSDHDNTGVPTTPEDGLEDADFDPAPSDATLNHRFAVFPAGSITSVEQANDVICAMSAGSLGEPSVAMREVLLEMPGAEDDVKVIRPADRRGFIIATTRPEDGLLENLLRCTMSRGLTVYDVELFRLYDPSERVDIAVELSGGLTLPYLTRALLRDLVIRPTWPDRDSPFVIIDSGDQVYIQTYRNSDGTYRLECRDRGPDAHFAFDTADIGLVVDVMWAWTIDDPYWRAAVVWMPLELDEEPRERHVTLQNEHREDGSWLNLDAYLDPDGTLRIVGQDLGPVTAAISSDGEYEYFYTIAAADVPALVTALGGEPGSDVLELLVQRWSDEASYGLGGAIRSSGVRHHFANYC